MTEPSGNKGVRKSESISWLKLKLKLRVTELKLMTRSPIYRNFYDTYQIRIRCQCPVDRVLHNWGVRHSEDLLYDKSSCYKYTYNRKEFMN